MLLTTEQVMYCKFMAISIILCLKYIKQRNMKKLLLLLIAILGFNYASYAQNVSRNAIGLRLDDSNGFGAEISYQRGLSTKSRLEFDLGWSIYFL